MKPDEFIVPDDPGKLRDLVEVLMSELKSRDIKITDLEQRLQGMNRHRFWVRSENADCGMFPGEACRCWRFSSHIAGLAACSLG